MGTKNTAKMIEAAATDYSEFLGFDMNAKLQPINQSVDDMLTRLEEFEAMVLLIQQERCNAIGLTGALTDCIDLQPQVKQLCKRIDTLELLTEYFKSYILSLESRISDMEEKMGLGDSANVFKSFLKSSLFKKSNESKPQMNKVNEPIEDISIKQYFVTDCETKET